MKTIVPPMPEYHRTIKITAARITGWAYDPVDNAFLLMLDNGEMLEVSHSFASLNKPEIGHYFIADSSGKARTVPPDNFAANYVKAPPAALPELESLKSMQPQALVLMRDVPRPEPYKRELGVSAMMAMVKEAGRA